MSGDTFMDLGVIMVMVITITFVAVLGSVAKHYLNLRARRFGPAGNAEIEAARAEDREKIAKLEQRLRVLERIAVDHTTPLAAEIEQLRTTEGRETA